MPFYLLDTNILIDLAGEKSSKTFFEGLLEDPGVRLGTSILSIAEFAAGAGPQEEKFLKDWLQTEELEVICLDTVEDAFRAGELRRKHSLTLADALILASAVRERAHLLTHDEIFLKKAKTVIRVTDPLRAAG